MPPSRRPTPAPSGRPGRSARRRDASMSRTRSTTTSAASSSSDPLEELAAEVVVDLVLDIDASRRRALLPGRPEGAGVGRLDGGIELRVGEDDQRVVAAELELHALAEPRR